MLFDPWIQGPFHRRNGWTQRGWPETFVGLLRVHILSFDGPERWREVVATLHGAVGSNSNIVI